MKKIPISFNEQDEQAVRDLIDFIGISGVYGDFPKAVKFGINLALSAIKNPAKVYSSLNDDETTIYFQSLQRAEVKARMLARAKEFQENAKKV